MSALSTIRLDQRGAVAWITLNRPDAMNALSDTMCAELLDALHRIERDPGIRVIVSRRWPCVLCRADLKGVFEAAAENPARATRWASFSISSAA